VYGFLRLGQPASLVFESLADALHTAFGDLRHPEYPGWVPQGIWHGGRHFYWRRDLYTLYCRFERLMPIERDQKLVVALREFTEELGG
jgi:hypothetical protein